MRHDREPHHDWEQKMIGERYTFILHELWFGTLAAYNSDEATYWEQKLHQAQVDARQSWEDMSHSVETSIQFTSVMTSYVGIEKIVEMDQIARALTIYPKHVVQRYINRYLDESELPGLRPAIRRQSSVEES